MFLYLQARGVKVLSCWVYANSCGFWVRALKGGGVIWCLPFFNFDLLHVPLLEVILHALFHIHSYNVMLSSSSSSSSYILLRTVMA
jgi:hypothetical protein